MKNQLQENRTKWPIRQWGMSLLSCAVLGGCRDAREQAVVELERRGIAVTAAALMDAANSRDMGAIGYLGTAGVRAEAPEDGQPSVLQVAAEANNWVLFEKLLGFCDEKVINHRGREGRVVLESAVLADQWRLAEMLLNEGAKPELASVGVDALVRRVGAEKELSQKILAALPEGHEALSQALLREVAGGNAEGARHLLRRKASAAVVSPEGNGSALDLAAHGGFREIGEMLILHGAKASESPAALCHAAKRGDVVFAKMLLEAGASPQAGPDPARPEVTAMRVAVDGGFMKLIGLMLEHGGDGAFCAEKALSEENAELVSLLLEHGWKKDEPGSDGNPALVRAAISGSLSMVNLLLAHGAALDTTGALGQTAYHMAVAHRRPEAAAAMLGAGMRADAPFLKPDAKKIPEELVTLFDSEYFTKWYRRDENLTPLMLAASRGDTAMVRQLIDGGAKRGAQTRDWHRYPIVFACDTENFPAAQLLLGRDPDTEKDKRHAVISLSKQRVTLYRNDQALRSARVSTGKKSTPTPAGKYIITDKQADWVSTIYKVSMPYFMRFSCKEIGLHAGVVPGYPASHGCIRMPKSDVQAFYRILQIGDRVTIEP